MLVPLMGMLFLNHLIVVEDSWWLSKVTVRVTCSLLKADRSGWENILGGTVKIFMRGREREREREREKKEREVGGEEGTVGEVREGMCVWPSIKAGNSTMTNYLNTILI
jgi:hypothetical protein